MFARSTLTPRAFFPFGEGDVTRCTGASQLVERLCCWPATPLGTTGTGGALAAGESGRVLRPEGDGDRNVRSVIEPPLFCLNRPPLPTPPRAVLPTTLPLPTDDTDPRRAIRFVTRLPTGSGEEVCDRKAAAAAEEERAVLDGELFTKAVPAAAVAAVIVAGLGGGWANYQCCPAISKVCVVHGRECLPGWRMIPVVARTCSASCLVAHAVQCAGRGAPTDDMVEDEDGVERDALARMLRRLGQSGI